MSFFRSFKLSGFTLKLPFPEAVEELSLDIHQVANKKAIHVFPIITQRSYMLNVQKASQCHENNIENIELTQRQKEDNEPLCNSYNERSTTRRTFYCFVFVVCIWLYGSWK